MPPCAASASVSCRITTFRSLRRGELVSLLEANRPPNTAVWAVYPQRRYPLPKVRLLIQALKDGLAKRPEYLRS